MPADFLDAHERHWLDAELLLTHQRWANADHLYGMAAEYGLKRLMLVFGMPYGSKGDYPDIRDDKSHVDKVWDRYETYRSQHIQGAGYALPANPFLNWRAEQRYERSQSFSPTDVQAHKTATGTVRHLIQQAQRAGLI